MKCANCNAELTPGERFCGECGKPVEAGRASLLVTEPERCPRCGVENEGSERFCGSCGLDLQTAAPQSPAPVSTPTARPKHHRWLIAAMLGIVAIGGVGFWEYVREKESKSFSVPQGGDAPKANVGTIPQAQKGAPSSSSVATPTGKAVPQQKAPPGQSVPQAGDAAKTNVLTTDIPKSQKGAPSSRQMTFANPMQGGYRLDWCHTWATDCGEQAATAWCRSKGYAAATNWTQDVNVDERGFVTKIIGDDQLCTGPFCDSFTSITCSSGSIATPKPPGQTVRQGGDVPKADVGTGVPPKTKAAPSSGQTTFANPMHDGYRLDWCHTWATDCGEQAATAWCNSKGYAAATNLMRDVNVDERGFVTKIIGDGQLCTGPGCDSFTSITCSSTSVATPK